MNKDYCKIKGCTLSPSSGGLCWKHQNSKLPQKEVKVKKKTRIKPKSDKRAEEDKEYAKLRKEYLSIHKDCEMCSENDETNGINKATEIHHRMRRSSKKLRLDTNQWFASCRMCNSRIEEEPAWGKKHGFIAKAEYI